MFKFKKGDFVKCSAPSFKGHVQIVINTKLSHFTECGNSFTEKRYDLRCVILDTVTYDVPEWWLKPHHNMKCHECEYSWYQEHITEDPHIRGVTLNPTTCPRCGHDNSPK